MEVTIHLFQRQVENSLRYKRGYTVQSILHGFYLQKAWQLKSRYIPSWSTELAKLSKRKFDNLAFFSKYQKQINMCSSASETKQCGELKLQVGKSRLPPIISVNPQLPRDHDCSSLKTFYPSSLLSSANVHWAPKTCLALSMKTDMQAANYGRGN